MAGGFNNAILGGVSKLIRAAIQSPNFVTNLSGWTINKDGSAEFADVNIRGTITLDNASDAILVYDVNGDLAFAITQDSSTLPPHTSNPIVFGDHLGVGANAFGVLSFKTQHTSDWDMYITEVNGYPVLLTRYIGNGSPTDIAFGGANLNGAIPNGIGIAPRYPDIVPGTPGPSRWQFGNGLRGAYYHEQVKPSAQVIPSGVVFNNLTNLTAETSNSDYGSMFNLATGIWTCAENGFYSFGMSIAPTTWVSGSRLLGAMSRNGTATVNCFRKADDPDNAGVMELTSEPLAMAVNDTVTFRYGQVTGGNVTLATDERSRITVHRHL